CLVGEKIVDELGLAIYRDSAVGQHRPQLRVARGDAAEPEQLVLDVLEGTRLVRAGDVRDDPGQLERIRKVACRAPPPAYCGADDLQRRSADALAEDPASEALLRLGLGRRVGQDPSQADLVVEQRDNAEQLVTERMWLRSVGDLPVDGGEHLLERLRGHA